MYYRIRDLREDHDLLQKDVAAYLKCTQVCYSNYVDYLLGLTDEAKPYPRSH